MKKPLLYLFFCLILFSVAPASAIDDPTSGAAGMASFFPADTFMFFAVRTDEGFIDELDQLTQALLAQMPETGIPALTLRQAFDFALINSDTSLDEIYQWLGDAAAVGVSGDTAILADQDASNDNLLTIQAVVKITNKQRVVDLLNRAITTAPNPPSVGERDGFTVYSQMQPNGEVILAVGEDRVQLMFGPGSSLSMPDPALSADSDYVRALSKLSADSYNLVGFIDTPALLRSMSSQAAQIPGFSPDSVGALAVGATILDTANLTLDIAQLPGATAGTGVKTINRDFMRFIPANANAVIHATDLSGLLNSLFDSISQMAQASDAPRGQDPALQIRGVFNVLGIELDEDFLSWTTGDYALFLHSDLIALLEGAQENRIDLAGNFDLGLVIETADPAAAKTFAGKLSAILMQMGGGPNAPQGLGVSSEQINGVDVTVISIAAPVSPEIVVSLDLLLGATDEVFFLATRDAATTMLNGGESLANNPDYIAAGKYMLSNPTSLWYTDGEGLVVSIAVPAVGILALLGPAIGNIFENIVDELQFNPAPNAYPIAQQNPNVELAQMIQQLEASLRLIASSSITSTVTEDGTTLIRLVLSYRYQ